MLTARMAGEVYLFGMGDEDLWEQPGFNLVRDRVMHMCQMTGKMIVYNPIPTYSRMTKRAGDPYHFIGDDEKRYNIFGQGGVKKTSEEFNKEFLGEIPIIPKVGEMSDKGKPIVESDPEDSISKIYIDFAKKVKNNFL